MGSPSCKLCGSFVRREPMSEPRAIVFCHCAGRDVLPSSVRDAVAAELKRRQVPFLEVGDLCARMADRDEAVLGFMSAAAALTVVACHPRAVRNLLRAAGVAAGADQPHVLDMRVSPAQDIIDAVASGDGYATPPALSADGEAGWFPVIDRDRCVQCKQCVSFCLFGVYAVTQDGRVAVNQPRACKNNCPACARICPEVAIIFPKLPTHEAPLDGAEISGEEQLKAKARTKAYELLGDDLYAGLAERQWQARRRRLLRTAQERAEAERAACAAKAGVTVSTPAPPSGEAG